MKMLGYIGKVGFEILQMNRLINFLEDGYLNLISGITGALAWSLHKQRKFWTSIHSIVSGSLASVFLTPEIAKIIKVNENYLAFIIGIVGMSLIEESFSIIVKNKIKLIDALKAAIRILNK